jgi:hypothetical protein
MKAGVGPCQGSFQIGSRSAVGFVVGRGAFQSDVARAAACLRRRGTVGALADGVGAGPDGARPGAATGAGAGAARATAGAGRGPLEVCASAWVT